MDGEVNIETLLVSSPSARKSYGADTIMAILDGTAGSGGSARTVTTVTYATPTTSPTVYYTALNPDGSVLSARSTSGIVLANGLYQHSQNTTGLTDFIAVWDEGDVNVYAAEWIVVDT